MRFVWWKCDKSGHFFRATSKSPNITVKKVTEEFTWNFPNLIKRQIKVKWWRVFSKELNIIAFMSFVWWKCDKNSHFFRATSISPNITVKKVTEEFTWNFPNLIKRQIKVKWWRFFSKELNVIAFMSFIWWKCDKNSHFTEWQAIPLTSLWKK